MLGERNEGAVVELLLGRVEKLSFVPEAAHRLSLLLAGS
jgi:hypothetical protein